MILSKIRETGLAAMALPHGKWPLRMGRPGVMAPGLPAVLRARKATSEMQEYCYN
jgi:hypothetical protein